MEESTDILIVSYLKGEATNDQQKELLAWLELSEENRFYFRSIKDVYDLGRIESDIRDSQVDRQWHKFLDKVFPVYNTNSWLRIGHILLRYAAVFAFGLICMQLISYFISDKETYSKVTKVETGVGERSKVSLPDGSIVWVNACSSISYDESFGKENRTIRMRGEAFFDVEKDQSKPFLVHAEPFTFRVTGTSFNVYAFDEEDEISLALIEGSVTAEKGSYMEKLRPGEVLVYDKTQAKISHRKLISSSYTAWRYGEMFFDKMTFEDLTRRLERNFNVKFKFENQKIKKESFGGSFRKYESLETIMRVISTSTPVKYRIEKDTVYIK